MDRLGKYTTNKVHIKAKPVNIELYSRSSRAYEIITEDVLELYRGSITNSNISRDNSIYNFSVNKSSSSSLSNLQKSPILRVNSKNNKIHSLVTLGPSRINAYNN